MKKKIAIMMVVVPICVLYGYIMYDIYTEHGFSGVALAICAAIGVAAYIALYTYLTFPR